MKLVNPKESLLPRKQAIDLLILVAQDSPNESRIVQLLQREIDWVILFALAEEHRITPILFEKLKTYAESIPPDILEKLRARVVEIGKLNFARTAQLLKLVKILQSQQLDILCYKGMALASLAYGDVALRQYTDIDVLIRKQEFAQIKDILLVNNCRPAHEFTESQERATLKYAYEFPFYHDENDTLIEVHWDFIESFFAFDFYSDEIWDRTVEIEMYGKKIRTLCPEDYLIILSTHGSKHYWNRLAWVCDIDRLVRNTKIDWSQVESRAESVDAMRMIRIGVLLSNRLLDTPIPESMDADFRKDTTAKELANKFATSLFEEDPKPFDWKQMAKVHLRIREKAITKLTYCVRLLRVKLTDKLFMPMGRPQ